MEFRVVCDGNGTRRASQGRGRRSDRVLIAASMCGKAVRGDAQTNVGLFPKMRRLISPLSLIMDIHTHAGGVEEDLTNASIDKKNQKRAKFPHVLNLNAETKNPNLLKVCFYISNNVKWN